MPKLNVFNFVRDNKLTPHPTPHYFSDDEFGKKFLSHIQVCVV